MAKIDLFDLKKIGLTDGEISVYQALLDIGECTKTKLAKQSGVSPSNIYDITNRLIEKGMVSKVEKNGVAHFSCASPHHIMNYLDDKEKEVSKERDFVNEILPALLAKFNEQKEKVNVEVFIGWNGMKIVFDDLINELEKGEHNYVFGASKGESAEKADMFFLKMSRKRAEKGIITNIIFNEELRKRKERIEFFIKSRKCNVKFLQQSTPAEIIVYKDRTIILILTKDPLLIRITGKEVNESFKQYFDLMWGIALT